MAVGVASADGFINLWLWSADAYVREVSEGGDKAHSKTLAHRTRRRLVAAHSLLPPPVLRAFAGEAESFELAGGAGGGRLLRR